MIEARWAAAPQEEWDAARAAMDLDAANAAAGGDWMVALERAEAERQARSAEQAARARVAATMGGGEG